MDVVFDAANRIEHRGIHNVRDERPERTGGAGVRRRRLTGRFAETPVRDRVSI